MRHAHIFNPSEFKDYEVCCTCGSYHSTAQVEPVVIYEQQEYWSYDNKRSKIDEQVLNLQCTDDCGISKVDRILQFVPETAKTALEIGCAPGVLLKKLIEKKIETWGIEPSGRYINFICEQAIGANVIQGYFPQATVDILDGQFDCIIAMDVFEHCEKYEAFIDEIKRLLSDNGTAIIMSPIILTEDGLFRKRDFEHPDEHCWIWTQKFLEPYLKQLFSEVKFSRWICGHEIIICLK